MSVNNEKQAFTPMSVETELSLYCDLIDLIEKYSNCSHIIYPHLSERLRKYIKENPEKFKEERSKREKTSLNEKEQIEKINSTSIKPLSFEKEMFEISRSRNDERISKAETDAEYAIIISVSALILSFLAFLFSLAKG